MLIAYLSAQLMRRTCKSCRHWNKPEWKEDEGVCKAGELVTVAAYSKHDEVRTRSDFSCVAFDRSFGRKTMPYTVEAAQEEGSNG